MAIEVVRRNGPYAPLSATYYQDDDITEVGEAAELLFVRTLAFCAGRPSDGFISEAQIHRFVAVGMADVDKRIDALVEVGLFERIPGGYLIRSWLKWNRSAEELGQYRAKDRDRKRSQSMERIRSDRSPDGPSDSERTPSGIRSDAPQATVETVDKPSEQGNHSERNPSGVGADSDTHYTSLHDTSLHENTSAPEARESDDGLLPGYVETQQSREPKSAKLTTRNAENHPAWSPFWSAYPRKVDKGHAKSAWVAKVNAGVDPWLIAEGAQRYRDNPRRPTEAKFIPHPGTWINGERWTDEERVVPAAAGRKSAWWDN